MNKLRWGILSTSKIAREKVIPALQKSALHEVRAMASENKERLTTLTSDLNIPVAYDRYEDLLNDPEIDAVYIPLPNHLHVPWAIKAIKANKHVLCEKPVGLNATEARQLAGVADHHPELVVMEAFMYRFHPQWIKVQQLVKEGKIGTLRTIQSFFSYNNTDPQNIRNKKELGGGALMDIGCYCISFARLLFEAEPKRVLGLIETDEQFGTDRISSGLMDFGNGSSSFTCSTQMMPFQRVQVLGTKGRIEVEVPVNAPPNDSMRLTLFTAEGAELITIPPVDQYTLQADAFYQAVNNGQSLPVSMQDAINNMMVIDALFTSAREERWVGL
jgi:predicted dehydrogenase